MAKLRSYGMGNNVGKDTVATAEEYLDMLISKNTFSTSSQLQKKILAALKGMGVPAPTIGIVYDKAGIAHPAFQEGGFYCLKDAAYVSNVKNRCISGNN